MKTQKWVLMVVVSVAVVSLVMSTAAASPGKSDTPLYTVRMEQASSAMNFLPSEKNNFTYTTEPGYTLEYNGAQDMYGMQYLYYPGTNLMYYTCHGLTCYFSCNQGQTCFLYETCRYTCSFTCESCLYYSCWGTCLTCSSTCVTCPATCGGQTWCYQC
jgi:hypothetical protein